MSSIGVFDSGIGGLTVVRELFRSLPHERIVYFGDTARVPYGSKSPETVQKYAREDTELLLGQDVDLIIIACNTVSATALDDVKRLAGKIPVIGMIEPCAAAAVEATTNGKIGVIGTEATVRSGAYIREITSAASANGRSVSVIQQACPLFVPLAEEGWGDHEAARLIAEEYLSSIKAAGVDTLILGCTHYPVLTDLIQAVMGAEVKLLNSGAIASMLVPSVLPRVGEVKVGRPEHLILVSDVPQRFQIIGERFLGYAMPEARQVEFKEAWVARR